MSTHPYPQFFSTPDEFSRAGVDALRNIADGTVESANRLAALQIEATQAAVTENAKQFRAFLQNTAHTSAAMSQWLVLFQASVQRFSHMAKYYLENASQDLVDMNRWFGQALSPLAPAAWTSATAAGEPRRERRVQRDRRVAAQLITFPERRASELAKAAAMAAAESARQATESIEQAASEAGVPAATATAAASETLPPEPAQPPAPPGAPRGKPEPTAGPPKRGGSRRRT